MPIGDAEIAELDNARRYSKGGHREGAYENASTEKSSTGGWNNQVWKNEVRMAGMENASTNSADKVKHNNSPIILRSGKQLSPFSLNWCNVKKTHIKSNVKSI